MIQKLKSLLPFLLIIVFIFLIYNFYLNNKKDFYFIYNFSLELLIKILCLCFIYLISEAIILKKIVSFYNKEINLNKSFLVICSTYLCNTFVQFSGLGFRAFYLNKVYNIKVIEFIILSLYVILIEVFVFSFFGILILSFFEFINIDYKMSSYLKFILISLITITTVVFLFSYNIFFYISKLLNFKKKRFFILIANFIEFKSDKDLKIFLIKFIPIFFMQFLLLVSIFYFGHSIFDKGNNILFSVVAAVATDLSFIFTFTPYAIGVSEAFIFFGTTDMSTKLSEIIFVTNLFRLSIFLIYCLFGTIYLYSFFRKN